MPKVYLSLWHDIIQLNFKQGVSYLFLLFGYLLKSPFLLRRKDISDVG